MISELLDEFTILGWRTYLLTCLTDEIVVKNHSAETNTISAYRELYYYRLPREEHDQDFFSTKFTNTIGMFLTRSFRNVIERSDTYFPININGVMGTFDTNKLIKLIEHCCNKNNWGSLSFFDNTLREIIFIDCLITQTRRIVEDLIIAI